MKMLRPAIDSLLILCVMVTFVFRHFLHSPFYLDNQDVGQFNSDAPLTALFNRAYLFVCSVLNFFVCRVEINQLGVLFAIKLLIELLNGTATLASFPAN